MVRTKSGSLCYGNGDWYFTWSIHISVSFFALPYTGCWTINSGDEPRCYGIVHSTFSRRIHISASILALMLRGGVTVSIRVPQFGSGEKSVRKEISFFLLRNIHLSSWSLERPKTKIFSESWSTNYSPPSSKWNLACCLQTSAKRILIIKGRVMGPYYICCSNFTLTAVSDAFQAHQNSRVLSSRHVRMPFLLGAIHSSYLLFTLNLNWTLSN